MKKAEAIELLRELSNFVATPPETDEAINMAIEALDQEPIIHCKDCKYWHEWENGTGSCHRSDIMWVGSDYYDYCSFAEKNGE